MVILSAGDIVDLFRNRISGAQFVKNVTTTGATIAGGGAGWGFGNTGGAAIGGWVGGTIAGPAGAVKGAEVGAKIGGFTGSVIGGATAGTVTHSALDGMIEDDTVFMMRIAEQEFAAICEQYLLTENEVYLCLEMLKKRLDKKELKNIFSSSNRELYVQSIIMKCVDPVLKKREYIKEFDSEDVFWGMRMLIEDAVDGEGIFDKNAYAPSMAEVKENLLQNTNVKDENEDFQAQKIPTKQTKRNPENHNFKQELKVNEQLVSVEMNKQKREKQVKHNYQDVLDFLIEQRKDIYIKMQSNDIKKQREGISQWDKLEDLIEKTKELRENEDYINNLYERIAKLKEKSKYSREEK